METGRNKPLLASGETAPFGNGLASNARWM
jgi:hypothetical protein